MKIIPCNHPCEGLYSLKNLGNRNRTFVFDIDDTCLDKNFDAIPATKEVYDGLISSGNHVFFVTARPYSPKALEITNSQLIKAGFQTFDGLYLRPTNYQPTVEGIAAFKHAVVKSLANVSVVIGNAFQDLSSPEKMQLLYESHMNPENAYIIFFPDSDHPVALKLPDKYPW